MLDGIEATWNGAGRKVFRYDSLPRGEGWHRVQEIDVTDDTAEVVTLIVPYKLPFNGNRNQMMPLVEAQKGNVLSVREARFAGWEDLFKFGEKRKGRCVVEEPRFVTNKSYEK